MELPQLRYVVTLVEKLHFGRAAAREYMVRLALSQQLQRLERELGVLLLDRTTPHEVPVARLAAQLAPSRGSCAGVVGAP